MCLSTVEVISTIISERHDRVTDILEFVCEIFICMDYVKFSLVEFNKNFGLQFIV